MQCPIFAKQKSALQGIGPTCGALHYVVLQCTAVKYNKICDTAGHLMHQGRSTFISSPGSNCTVLHQVVLTAMAQVVQLGHYTKPHQVPLYYCKEMQSDTKTDQNCGVHCKPLKGTKEDQLPFRPPGMYHLTKVMKDIYNQN